MKQYREYMDHVEVSGQFHDKLLALSAPEKKPAWKRYGAAAAALLLAVGVGAVWLSRLPAAQQGEAGVEPHTDLAALAPGEDPAGQTDAMKTIGGYEVPSGTGSEGLVSYCLLPWIGYGTLDGVMMADASLVPPDGGMRELTGDDVLAVFGLDEQGLSGHLDWGGYVLDGVVGFHADGSTCMMNFGGTADDGYFSLQLRAGELPIRDYIIVNEQRTVTDVWGVEVSGVKNTGAYGDADRGVYWDVTREVEFMAGDVGVRFKAYGSDDTAVELFTSRFVRWAIVEGLDLSRAAPDGALPAEAQPSFSVGEPNWEDGASTPAYDPSVPDEGN